MTVRFTDDVRLGPLSSALAPVWVVLASAPLDGIVWVTALDNGDHMKGSKHDPSDDTDWRVEAVDLDCGTTQQNERLTAYLKRHLPPAFDVILEDKGGPNEHVHVEYDPPRS